NQFRQYAGQNAGNLNGYNTVQNVKNQVAQNPRVQNDGIQNQIRTGNLVAVRAEGNAAGHNRNQIRCYNCRGVGHFARDCTVRPRRRDAAYLQTQLLIAQKEEAGIQLQAEDKHSPRVLKLTALPSMIQTDQLRALCYPKNDREDIGKLNLNRNGNLIAARAEGNIAGHNANLQQASTSATHTDKAPVYDSDESAKVHVYENCDDNEIFNMFTQEEQYTELLEPIPVQHQVPKNDNNVISEVTSEEQDGETVEQHPASFEEIRALYDSLYQNLAIEVEKVNSVNRKLKETNADLTTELARFKNQKKCFEISQEKYDKLERCYQQSIYQEQCLSKKINALHLSTEMKKLKSDFKTREHELLDKQIQLEKKIKELNNIFLKTGQSIQMIHMLSPKPDSFYHTEQKMALGYQNPFYLKHAQKKQQSLYDGKVLLEKHDSPVVHDLEETLQLAQESRKKMKQLNKEIKPANYTTINHLLREATKFVGDFKSLANEADASLAKHKALELEIKRLLKAVVS
nr:hypothetical protein [Tanacetum cinerariifolium]